MCGFLPSPETIAVSWRSADWGLETALKMDERKIIKQSEDQDINQDQEKEEEENPGQEQHSSYHYPVVLDTSRQAASFLNIEDMLFEVRTTDGNNG